MRILLLSLLFLVHGFSAANEPARKSLLPTLWMVEFQGKKTYLLGTVHSVTVSDEDFPAEILEIIRGADRVVFEQTETNLKTRKPRREQMDDRRPQSQKASEVFSPTALRALKRLFPKYLIDILASDPPGVAAYQIRDQAEPAIRHEIDKYGGLLAKLIGTPSTITLQEKQQLSQYAMFSPTPEESEFLKTRLKLDMQGSFLGDSMVAFLTRKKVPQELGVDDFLETYARKFQKIIGVLDDLEPTELERLNQTVTRQSLNRLLTYLAGMLQPELAGIHFWRQHFAYRVMDTALKPYYFDATLNGDEFLDLTVSPFSSGPSELSKAPGMEKYLASLHARHLNWLPEIEKQIGKGGAVIAVGVSHLGDDKEFQTPGLVQILRERGYRVYQNPCEGVLLTDNHQTKSSNP
ncbi:MAG: TraB/GumN family protein [Bdellovibrionales bacterium]